MSATRVIWRRLDTRLVADAENTRRGRTKPKPQPPLVCPCGERHWTWTAVAVCRWPGADISGVPPASAGCHAVVIMCGPRTVVELYQSLTDTRGRRRNLDRRGCGPQCSLRHSVYKLARNGEITTVEPPPEKPIKSRFRPRPCRAKQQEEEE
jgi:hypothetical protein